MARHAQDIGDNGQENGNYYIVQGLYTIVYRCDIEIMEKKMETTL